MSSVADDEVFLFIIGTLGFDRLRVIRVKGDSTVKRPRRMLILGKRHKSLLDTIRSKHADAMVKKYVIVTANGHRRTVYRYRLSLETILAV